MSLFLPASEIVELTDWEYLDALWIGEGYGFSSFLRLTSDPEILRSLTIDFSEFPPLACKAILDVIHLPLSKGMTLEEIQEVLGPPNFKYRYVDDRISYDFKLRVPSEYSFSCTVLDVGGLTYVEVLGPRPKRKGWSFWRPNSNV